MVLHHDFWEQSFFFLFHNVKLDFPIRIYLAENILKFIALRGSFVSRTNIWFMIDSKLRMLIVKPTAYSASSKWNQNELLSYK